MGEFFLKSISEEYDDHGNYIGNSAGGNAFHGINREPDRPGRRSRIRSLWLLIVEKSPVSVILFERKPDADYFLERAKEENSGVNVRIQEERIMG